MWLWLLFVSTLPSFSATPRIEPQTVSQLEQKKPSLLRLLLQLVHKCACSVGQSAAKRFDDNLHTDNLTTESLILYVS